MPDVSVVRVETPDPVCDSTDNLLRWIRESPAACKIALIGNIGAGKSTLLRTLHSILTEICSNSMVFSVPENVDSWREKKILDDHYGKSVSSRASSAFSSIFQVFGPLLDACKRELQSRDRVESSMGARVIELYERTIRCCTDVFTAASVRPDYKAATMDASHAQQFRDLCEAVDALAGGTLSKGFDAIVYVRTTPSLCYSRMQKRSRSCEAAVSLGDLQILHELHEDYIFRTCARNEGEDHAPRVFVVNCADPTEPASAIANRVLDATCTPFT